jgi:chorismate dehydratase
MATADSRGPIRIGAVSYLNARPLVLGLDEHPGRFSVRYDVPSRCAALLHEGAIDLGLIPSIEYLAGDYRLVPGIGVVSDGPVASVAIFTQVPVGRVRSIALDTSSRTSVALTRVLCARRFGIAPSFVQRGPDLPAMLEAADAALLIGDPALFADASALGVEKIDLGAEWKALTGLPFVYALWTGRPGAIGPSDIRLLQDARDRGIESSDEVAQAVFPGDPVRQAAGAAYLRRNIQHVVGDRELAGLTRFYELAIEIGGAPGARPIALYEDAMPAALTGLRGRP